MVAPDRTGSQVLWMLKGDGYLNELMVGDSGPRNFDTDVTQIAAAHDPNGALGLFVLEGNDSSLHELSPWTPSATWLTIDTNVTQIVVAPDRTGSQVLWMLKGDGYLNELMVGDNVPRNFDTDVTQIAAAHDPNGALGLFVLEGNDSSLHELSPWTPSATWLTIDTNVTQIVVAPDRTGSQVLWMLKGDGYLNELMVGDNVPRNFDTDVTQIAAAHDPNGALGLFVLEGNDSSLHELSPWTPSATWLTIDTNVTQIVVAPDRTGSQVLWMLKGDGYLNELMVGDNVPRNFDTDVTQIAAAHDPNGALGLFVLDGNDGIVYEVTPWTPAQTITTIDTNVTQIVVAPDRTGSQVLWMLKGDGYLNELMVGDSGPRNFDTDVTQIAAAHDPNGALGLFVLEGNDSSLHELSPWTPSATWLTIDTNVTQIVVAPDRTGSQVLWMLKGDGYLNELMVGDNVPRNFDTDVTQIAAAHDPNGALGLFVLEGNDSSLHELSPWTPSATWLTIDTNVTQIVVAPDRTGSQVLWMLKGDGYLNELMVGDNVPRNFDTDVTQIAAAHDPNGALSLFVLDGNDGIVYEVTPWTPAQTITTIDTNVTQIVVAPDRTGSQVLWMLKGDGYLNELMVGDNVPRNFDTDVTQIAAAHDPNGALSLFVLDGNDGIVYEVTPWTPAQTITTIDTNVTQIVVAPDRTGSQVLWMLKGDGYLNELMVGDNVPRNFDTDVTQIAAARDSNGALGLFDLSAAGILYEVTPWTPRQTFTTIDTNDVQQMVVALDKNGVQALFMREAGGNLMELTPGVGVQLAGISAVSASDGSIWYLGTAIVDGAGDHVIYRLTNGQLTTVGVTSAAIGSNWLINAPDGSIWFLGATSPLSSADQVIYHFQNGVLTQPIEGGYGTGLLGFDQLGGLYVLKSTNEVWLYRGGEFWVGGAGAIFTDNGTWFLSNTDTPDPVINRLQNGRLDFWDAEGHATHLIGVQNGLLYMFDGAQDVWTWDGQSFNLMGQSAVVAGDGSTWYLGFNVDNLFDVPVYQFSNGQLIQRGSAQSLTVIGGSVCITTGSGGVTLGNIGAQNATIGISLQERILTFQTGYGSFAALQNVESVIPLGNGQLFVQVGPYLTATVTVTEQLLANGQPDLSHLSLSFDKVNFNLDAFVGGRWSRSSRTCRKSPGQWSTWPKCSWHPFRYSPTFPVRRDVATSRWRA